jgi:hypothetical protein
VLYAFTSVALLGVAAMVFWEQLAGARQWLGSRVRARRQGSGTAVCDEENE